MSRTNTAHVTIDLDDVRRSDPQTVESAIMAWAKESDTTSSGPVGPTFSTSGPGSGWSKNHDATDFAERAVSDEFGALAYLDETDGKLATRPGWTEEGTSDQHDLEWTDESVICIECPSIEDAMEYPSIVAEMAQSVIDYHGACSDRAEWAKLIRAMRDAAEAVSEIDPADLDD